MRLIDADKLIKELCKQETELARHGIMLVKGEHSLYKIINSQPAVDNWIPVSERLPEEGQEVFAVIGNDEEYYYGRATYISNGVWFKDILSKEDLKYDVIAWVPIPKYDEVLI